MKTLSQISQEDVIDFTRRLATPFLMLDLNQALTDEGRVSRVRMIAALASRPQAVRGLVRLGLEGRRAAAALAAFLDAYVEQLAATSIVSPRPRVN